MATWQNLVLISSLDSSEVHEWTWDGEDLLLFRTTDGNWHAISAYCPHMQNYIPNGLAPGSPLDDLLKPQGLSCPYHGWIFNGTGHCVSIPPAQPVPKWAVGEKPATGAWPCRIEGEWLQIQGYAPSTS